MLKVLIQNLGQEPKVNFFFVSVLIGALCMSVNESRGSGSGLEGYLKIWECNAKEELKGLDFDLVGWSSFYVID